MMLDPAAITFLVVELAVLLMLVSLVGRRS